MRMHENDMLKSINKTAQEIFGTIGYPTRKNESWKYSDLSSFKSKSFKISNDFSFDNNQLLFTDTDDLNTLIIVNGKLVTKQIVDRDRKVEINSISNLLKNDNLLLNTLKHTASSNPFLIMNSAHLADGIHIRIPKGMNCKSPIYITSISSDKRQSHSNYSRIYIHAESGSQVTVIEHNIYMNNREYYKNKVLYLKSDKSSVIEHIKLTEESIESYSMNNLIIDQSKDSIIKSNNFYLGFGFMRNDLICNLNGENSSIELNGLFLGKDSQFIDNNIIINHNKPHSSSNVIYKGILNQHSKGVFNGLINVFPKCFQICSNQKNQNILLSKESKMNSNPKLKIDCDDVKCAHGSTTGNLDKDQLFYLRSRGIELQKARAILIKGFANDIVNNIKSDSIKKRINQNIEKITN